MPPTPKRSPSKLAPPEFASPDRPAPPPDLSPSDPASLERAALRALDRLYTIPEAAVLLAMRPRSLYQIAARGDIKLARPTPGAVRIPHSELVRMMQARTEVRQIPQKKRRVAVTV